MLPVARPWGATCGAEPVTKPSRPADAPFAAMSTLALYPPKRFFGAARKLEGLGLPDYPGHGPGDTGSRMDDVIYEEFKGTGNMELILDRKLAERRIFPALDVLRSGTRREELLLEENTLRMVWTMRRMLAQIGDANSIDLLLNRLSKTPSNADFLTTLSKADL
jgi:transcription termination factor Rho